MKSSSTNRIIFLMVLIILCANLFSSCSILPKEEEALAPQLVEPKKTEYDLYKVVRKDITKSIVGNGNLISAKQDEMYFKETGGIFKGFNVKYGEQVEKGTVLCTIDSGDLESRIKQQENNISKADLLLSISKEKYEKYLSMTVEQQPAAVDMKDMQSNIKIQEYDLDNARIALTELKKDYEDSIIKSPINGIVIYIDDIDAGEAVEAYKVLVTVADPNELQLMYTSEKLNDVKSGMKAKIKHDGKEYQGEVVLSPDNLPEVAKNKNKYVNSIIIKLKSLPEDVKWGDTLEFEVYVQTKKNVIVIPKKALKSLAGRNYVQIIDGQSKKLVDVEIGIDNSFDVEVISGLTEGQNVVQ